MKKIIGILFCMLMIATALPIADAVNVQSTWCLKENIYSKYYQINQVNTGVIGIRIVAKVFEVNDPNNLLGGVIKVDDTITGKYIYDSGTVDTNPNPKIGEYPYTSSSFGFEVNAGGLVFKTNPSNVDFGLYIANNWYNFDFYTVYSYNNLQLSNGMLVNDIRWQLVDYNGTAIDSDVLPTTAPVLADWESQFGLSLSGKDPDDLSKEYTIRAHVAKATKKLSTDVHWTTILQNQQSLLQGIDDLFREPLNQDVLWDNGLPHGYLAFSSQYKPTPQISREVVADVDATKPWVVTGGDFRIIINYVGGPQAITSVNVFFYKNQDDNTPSMIRYAERTATFVGTYTGNTYFDMPEVLMNVLFDSVTLTPGKWWICFQPVIDWDMYWLASNLTGLGCYMSWPDGGYPKWTDDNNIPPFNEDVDVSFRLFGYITSQPPNPPKITGPTKVKTNVKNDYILNAIDPDGDDVSYFVDWGDGTNSSWTSPSASGVNVTLSHAWTAKGTYTIKAKAKDIYNAESDRTTLVVSVPKIKSIDSLFRQFLQSHLNLFLVLQKIIQRLGLQ
jgi:hypothetical protein